MLVGISPHGVMRLRGLAADQPLHIVNPARGLRVLLLLEHTGSLSAEETGGERVVPGKSQTQEIARPPLDGTETPSVPGTLTVPNQSSSESSLYGKTLSAEPNPSPIRFRTGDHGLAEPNRNHRLAPHNPTRRTDAMANARRSLDQTAPDQAAPRHAQGAHQTKRCQNNRRTPTGANTSHNSARQTDVKARTGHPPGQAVPGTPTVPNQSSSESSLYGKTLSAEPNPSPIRFRTGDHGLAEPNRNHRLAPHNSARRTDAKARAGRSPEQAPTEASTRRANPPDQAAPRYTNRNRQPQWRPAISVAEIRNY